MDSKAIIAALTQNASSDIMSVFLPGSKETLAFRPITVGEQKTFSKIMIGNQKSSSVFKEMTLGLIKQLCLTPEKIDFKKMTDVDRMKIMVEFCAKNYFFPDTKLPCPKCKVDLPIHIDFKELSKIIDEFPNHADKVVNQETSTAKWEFTIGLPSAQTMCSVEKIVETEEDILQSEDNPKSKPSDVSTSKLDRLDKLYNSDTTLKAFIKKMKVFTSQIPGAAPLDVDFSTMTFEEQIQILNTVPLSIFNLENGLKSFIAENFIGPLMSIGLDVKCKKCGEEIKGGLSLQLFFL
jgi:hypothetical protein